MTTQIFTINLIPKSKAAPVFYCDQYDHGGRIFECLLKAGNADYVPASAASVTIEGTKPDGSTFTHGASRLTGANRVYADLYEDMTDVAGTVRIQVVVREGGNRTASELILLKVQRSARR